MEYYALVKKNGVGPYLLIRKMPLIYYYIFFKKLENNFETMKTKCVRVCVRAHALIKRKMNNFTNTTDY